MKVRICHILNSIGVGGVEKFVVGLVNAVDTTRCEVHIVVLKKGLNHLLPQIKIPFQFHEVSYDFSHEYTLKDLLRHGFDKGYTSRRSYSLLQIIKTIAPDLIHAHILPRELPLVKLLSASCNAALLFTDHELRINPRLRKINQYLMAFALRVLYKGVNVVSVGMFPYTYHTKFKIYDTHVCRGAICNAVQLEPTPKKDNPTTTSKLIFVYISRICANKGHHDLIRGWKMLPDRRALELWIVGPDELNGTMQEYVKNNLTDSSIKFFGVRDDIAEILSQTDVGIFPSDREGLPLALLEKMASGLPVIVSSIPELTSIIKDKINGLVYEQGNVADLASKMQILISSPDLRKKLGVEAQKNICEHYSFQKMLLKYNQVYNAVIKFEKGSFRFFKAN